MRRAALPIAVVLSLSLVALPGSPKASAQVPTEDPPLAAGREADPVVMTGKDFADWAAPANVALEAPSTRGKQCEAEGKPGEGSCTHNQYEDPDFSSNEHLKQAGVPVDRLLGYRWNGTNFEQIPFQVDEMTQRYLSNNNSGFAFYSETDPHHTYVFDREGFRWTKEDPDNPCLARPMTEVEPDPVPGLDTDDELVFMAMDAGVAAPADAPLPPGIKESYQVAVTDPANGEIKYAYVMKAANFGPAAAFDETNGYVRYERDENADVFLFSESSYDDYGATFKGAYLDPSTGECITKDDPATKQVEYPLQHRPGDQATITTPRYKFRYEGRWLMTGLQVSNHPQGDWTYGPDLVDQWKARAFQQRPSGQTPCCGFEEEVNNWGGSSILMGELSGPVRVIRETWGADSGTNVVRREIFYRDDIRVGSFLRVHVVPPLDGIYAQWDYNAGMVQEYFNPYNPDGVPIDGKNDEVFGNSRLHVGPDGVTYDGDDDVSEALDDATDQETQGTGATNEPGCSPVGPHKQVYDQLPSQLRKELEDACIYNDIDSPDPTFSGVNAGVNWEQVSGANGTVVLRTAIKQFTPGGTGQSLAAVPYYRDDSCFDDGTGSNPGPHLRGRGVDDGEFARYDSDGDGVVDSDRRCWDSDKDAAPGAAGDPQFFQGSIGTHGIHILLIADSDNASTTVPLTEIDTEQRLVVLPGHPGNVGERYGRHSEKPLVPAATPEDRPPAPQTFTRVRITGPTEGQTTDVVTLAATLTDANGPVAGETLSFTLEGNSAGTAVTDERGVASVEVTLGGPARSTEVRVSYEGSASRTASLDTATFKILHEDSSAALDVVRDRSDYVAIVRMSETDTGAGLSRLIVEFFLNGSSVGTAITGPDGSASLPLPRNQAKVGDRVAVSFAGDSYYSGSSAEHQITK